MITSNLRPRRRRPADVNITPLIDVVFLLLIFFMVSTTFNRYSEIQIELPQSGVAEQDPASAQIDLTIDREGRFYVEQREVVNTTVETLQSALRKALGERKPVPVVISADAQTPHQAVITAMDAASRLGLNQISFATARLAAEAN